MLTSMDRSSPAFTTAFCVMRDTRISTVVEMVPSAMAHTEANSMMAISAIASFLRLFLMPYSSHSPDGIRN